MAEMFTLRAAGAGVRAMTLGADETSRLADEGVEPTDDGSKFAWTSAVGGKVGWGGVPRKGD